MNIYSLRVCLTNHDELATMPQSYRSPGDVIAYLNEKPENAVVIIDADTSVADAAHRPRHFQYIIRGASGELNNFYYGAYDEDSMDPNDANGGDLDAQGAISQAVNDLLDLDS